MNGKTLLLLPLLLATIVLASCGDPVGSECHMTGSGFSAKDNCRYRCLEYRDIVCPNGDHLTPKTCSGRRQCDPGSCPDGQVCYHVNDPFKKESYCLQANICGTHTAAELTQWERSSQAESAQSIREWEEKKQRMNKNKTPTTGAFDEPNNP